MSKAGTFVCKGLKSTYKMFPFSSSLRHLSASCCNTIEQINELPENINRRVHFIILSFPSEIFFLPILHHIANYSEHEISSTAENMIKEKYRTTIYTFRRNRSDLFSSFYFRKLSPEVGRS